MIEFSLNARWRRRTIRSKPLASAKWGRFYTNLCNNGSSCEMKLVAAAGSIFYNFIILQAFPKIKRKPQRFGVPGSWPDAERPELHYVLYGCLSPADLNWTGQARSIASA